MSEQKTENENETAGGQSAVDRRVGRILREETEMLTLTGKEIKDLAEAVGLVIAPHDYTDEMETEMTIIECPVAGVLDDNGKATHYAHVAYLSEYPEEGTFPLGEELCPKCKKPWLEHDFGVPAPTC